MHPATASALVTLTPRELAVVELLSRGCSYGEVGLRLGISPHTVATHIKNLYRKLEVPTAAAGAFLPPSSRKYS